MVSRTTVVNAPRTVITRIDVTFVAIAHNVVQPIPFTIAMVAVTSEPTDASW